MEKKDIVKELIIILWLFVIGSFIGYIVEMIVAFVQNGYFESRKGLIYGPFTPIYGAGIVIYYLVLNNMDTKDMIKVFFVTALVRRSDWVSLLISSRKVLWYYIMGLFKFDI